MIGFHRVSSPIGFFPTSDTQFYLYFQDDRGSCLNQDKQEISLIEAEAVDYKWRSPDTALNLYSHK